MSRTIRALAVALAVFLCADAQAQSHKVTERRNVDYVPQADYRDGKDRLDLYIPDGVTNAPVILSVHGGVLMAGDRSEERFASRTSRRRLHGSTATSGSMAAIRIASS